MKKYSVFCAPCGASLLCALLLACGGSDEDFAPLPVGVPRTVSFTCVGANPEKPDAEVAYVFSFRATSTTEAHIENGLTLAPTGETASLHVVRYNPVQDTADTIAFYWRNTGTAGNSFLRMTQVRGAMNAPEGTCMIAVNEPAAINGGLKNEQDLPGKIHQFVNTTAQ